MRDTFLPFFNEFMKNESALKNLFIFDPIFAELTTAWFIRDKQIPWLSPVLERLSNLLESEKISQDEYEEIKSELLSFLKD